MNDDRRLIEDYLPIQAISKEASREKSIRKGHISTLHLWWARRPLVACRAAVYGALVPASQFVPENGPDNKKQSLGRANAAKFVIELCKYPGSPRVIAEAQKHILDAHAERLTAELAEAAGTGQWPAWVEEFKWPKAEKQVTRHDIENGRAPRPRVLDMFAGGGAIPLEALRLGCEAYALDLNPVAHIIELCTLVYPQKYGKPDPSVPGMTGPRQAGGLSSTWGGLAEEVRYWGNWVLERVRREIGDLYPPIPDPEYKGKRSEIEFDRKTGQWVVRSGRTGVPPVETGGGRTGAPPVETGGGRTGVSPVAQGDLFQTRRHLPHWQTGGSVYFVTFSTRKVQLPDACRQIILDACRHWDGTKIRLHLACVMPDHVHAIMEPLSEAEGRFHDLSKVLHSIKSFAAHEVNKVLNRTGPLWEEESWDRIIRDEKDYEEKWNYILNNPVKAGLADSAERYPFLYVNAEARDATGETGETPVIPLEPPPGYLTPVAYLWTRTVKCKNPACGATVPLVRQTWLCKKAKRYVALAMHATKGSGRVTFEVVESDTEAGLGFDPAGFSKAGNATCPFCGTVADNSYVKSEGRAGRMGTQPMAVVCTRPGARGKVYLAADSLPPLPPGEGRGEGSYLPDDDAIRRRIDELCRRTGLTMPDEPITTDAKNSCWTHLYGLTTFGHLFTPRQMLCLLTFTAAVRELIGEVANVSLDEEQAKVLGTCLALTIDRMADWNSCLCTWVARDNEPIP
ncbi:MAG: DUF1156 domain-containing protein [Planctomycetota bacterium]